MVSTVETPSEASMIDAIRASPRNRSMIRCLAGASSSATRTESLSGAESGMRILSGPSQRQRYFHLGSTASAAVHGKTGFAIGIKPGHTLPRHGKPSTAGSLQRPARWRSHAVVEHANVEAVPVALRGHNHG